MSRIIQLFFTVSKRIDLLFIDKRNSFPSIFRQYFMSRFITSKLFLKYTFRM
jgi:hypothetical protein